MKNCKNQLTCRLHDVMTVDCIRIFKNSICDIDINNLIICKQNKLLTMKGANKCGFKAECQIHRTAQNSKNMYQYIHSSNDVLKKVSYILYKQYKMSPVY